MIMQSQGKIFLADERGVKQGPASQACSTFNFEDYFNPVKNSFGNIYALNDFMLAGSASLSIKVPKGFYVVLLPVSGAVSYSDSSISNKLVVAGQAQVISTNKDIEVEIKNPFREDIVNFLQILVKAEKPALEKGVFQCTYDDVNRYRNKPVLVFPCFDHSLNFSMHIGKFSGRGEATYTLQQTSKGFFGFVLDGVFEVEGRLLHARDGLALWNTEQVEMEALSNDAIILIIETEKGHSEKV